MAARIPVIFTFVATLLPAACGFGGGPATSDFAGSSVSTTSQPDEVHTPTDTGSVRRLERRDLERAREDLARARQAVSAGEGLTAGAHLSLAVRELEDGLARTGAGITPAAAATFEEARRTADRWQAGETPSDRGPDALLDRVDLEARRLAQALEA